MKKILLNSAFVLAVLSVVFTACKSEKSGDINKPRIQVYLTDDPGDYEKVLIDIWDILYNSSGDTVNGWQSLPGVNAGVYDLLKLINDQDTLLADAEIPSGRLHQIRLVLGPGNFVKLQGNPTMIKLETPSAQQSGLKLNIQHDVVNGILYKITLDFDVAKSIVKTGNNKYLLKPTIRTVLDALGGSIKGVVRPNSFATTVYAIRGLDSFSTYTSPAGNYLIKGLDPGTYSVYFLPGNNTYQDSMRTGFNVVVNSVTTVDTMFLQQ